ncbi:SEC14-like protein 2 [Chionoecetes opilio]|uniref:SEC14-like protein 2 n=1 Tax=Chionoecetes opilio TaxID=41210 RepID=A0A8J4XW10_CHIOP|nr:SEC14-like protein 2 [Chionoecetes opilio]
MRLFGLGWEATTFGYYGSSGSVPEPPEPATGPDMELTPEKKEAISRFRERVSTVLPLDQQHDYALLQWLTARNFNIDKAEQMLKKSLEWRREWGADTVLEWEVPEVLSKYYPVGIAGHDKTGCPVWVIPYGGCDMRGLLSSVKKADYIRYTIRVLEASRRDMGQQTQLLGRPVAQQCCIFDLDNFSLKHVTWKPAMDVILELVQLYEANYPEFLKCAYVINAPKVFTMAYALIKPFLHEVTLKKIKIFGTGGWKEALLQDIDREQLPQHWGGTLTDPDGDPKCPSQARGEVPKKYYLSLSKSNLSKLHETDNLSSITLGKGGKKRLKYDVKKPGSHLRWEFRTEDFDIGFGVSRKVKKGEEEVLLPLQRVNSQLVTEEGYLVCTEPGTYVVTFDNEFSYVRSKKVLYMVSVVRPDKLTEE